MDGTLSALLKAGGEAGIGGYVVHSVATTPEQVVSINNFIADRVREYPGVLTGFATIHPDFGDIGGEMERAASIGLKGVKIHPDFQKFAIDDEKAFEIYRHIEGKLPLLAHTGDYRYTYSKAFRVARVLEAFPGLTFIGAHFGGWSEWEAAADVLKGYDNLYVDTSSSLYTLTPEKARRLIDAFGVERVLFGTDYPMWNPREEFERFGKIPLDATERERILHKNAEVLLGI
jgi:predicted TIM-barrel fold metal-dependent hydrolase